MSQVSSTRRKRYSKKWLWQASVVPEVLQKVMTFGVFSLVIVVIHQFWMNISLPSLGLVVPAVVLGLLLVFRTNTAYDRFWEARKLWSRQIGCSFNFAQYIWIAITTQNEIHGQQKQQVMREEIGVEIQNPFGYDENDLPLDQFCQQIRQEIEEIMTSTGEDDDLVELQGKNFGANYSAFRSRFGKTKIL